MSASPESIRTAVAGGAASSRVALLERVGRIVQSDLAPLVRRVDEGEYPEGVLRRLGEAGAVAPAPPPPAHLFDASAAVGRGGGSRPPPPLWGRWPGPLARGFWR